MVDIDFGTLGSGKQWHLVESRRKDPDIKEGQHLILEVVTQPTPDMLSESELNELRLLAFKLAEQHASEPGRWRVDFNGPGVATRPHFHCHIKLPAGKDKLRSLYK